MPLGVEEDDEQHHFHSDLNDQNFIQQDDNENELHDENYIQDEYEEPMDLLF